MTGVPTHGAQLAKWLANPGLRAKLPNSALPAAQLAQRRANQHAPSAHAPAAPADPFDAAAAQAASEKYAQPEALLRGQIQESGQQAANDAGWFRNYQNTINASNAAINQAYQQGQQDVVHIGQGLSQAAGAQGAQTDQAMAADAANRGTTVAPGVAQVGQQASGVRRDLAGSFAGLLATQGAAANQAGQQRAQTAVGQGVQAQLNELQNRRSLAGQQVVMAKEKGQYQQVQKASLQDAAHKSALEDAAFNLNAQRTGASIAQGQASTANAKANTNLAKGRLTLDQQKALSATERDKYQRDHALGPYKPGGSKATKLKSGFQPLGKETTIVQNIGGAQHAVSALMKTPGAHLGEIRQILQAGKYDGKKYSTDEITAALDLFQNNGQLTAAGVAAARRLKIHVNGNFKIAKSGGGLAGASGTAAASTGATG